jgi:cephalosporin hydroxylase
MNLDDIHGWFDFQNIYDRMANEVRDGGTIVELGVWKGKSIIYLAQAIQKTGKNIQLIGIDNFQHSDWDGYSTLQRIDRERGETRTILQQCQDNIAAFGLSDRITIRPFDSIQAAKTFPDGSVDFVFVDDMHNNEHVKAELGAWIPKMRRPTWMAGHDYPGIIAGGVLHHFPNAKQDGGCWIGELP